MVSIEFRNNAGRRARGGAKLRPMTFCIEPMTLLKGHLGEK
jgi:hypothetical protein